MDRKLSRMDTAWTNTACPPDKSTLLLTVAGLVSVSLSNPRQSRTTSCIHSTAMSLCPGVISDFGGEYWLDFFIWRVSSYLSSRSTRAARHSIWIWNCPECSGNSFDVAALLFIASSILAAVHFLWTRRVTHYWLCLCNNLLFYSPQNTGSQNSNLSSKQIVLHWRDQNGWYLLQITAAAAETLCCQNWGWGPFGFQTVVCFCLFICSLFALDLNHNCVQGPAAGTIHLCWVLIVQVICWDPYRTGFIGEISNYSIVTADHISLKYVTFFN